MLTRSIEGYNNKNGKEENKNRVVKNIKTNPIIIRDIKDQTLSSGYACNTNNNYSISISPCYFNRGSEQNSKFFSSPNLHSSRIHTGRLVLEKKNPRVDLRNLATFKNSSNRLTNDFRPLTAKLPFIMSTKENNNQITQNNTKFPQSSHNLSILQNYQTEDNSTNSSSLKQQKINFTSNLFSKTTNIDGINKIHNKLLFINQEIEKLTKSDDAKFIELIKKTDNIEDISPTSKHTIYSPIFKCVNTDFNRAHKFNNFKISSLKNVKSNPEGFYFKSIMGEMQTKYLTIKDIKNLK